jgi:hypothetical protein
MKKFESLEYFKSVGLPICRYNKYSYADYDKAIEFANSLRRKGLMVGLRTELTEGNNPGQNCPFIIDISNFQIKYNFMHYKDKYTYLISEAFSPYDVITQGTVYLLCDRKVVIFSNETDKCTCRKAIENPNNGFNVVCRIRNWDSLRDRYSTLRNLLLEACKKDDYIVGKRIEWSLFKRRGYIFWQITSDSLPQGSST